MNPEQERREHYKHIRQIPTRWRDNDVYHHINNVIYYEFFDTVINGYLMEAGGLDFSGGDAVGFAVETHCQFLKPIGFPDAVDACLRVGKLGNSSVRYEIGIFKQGDKDPCRGRIFRACVCGSSDAEAGADRWAAAEGDGSAAGLVHAQISLDRLFVREASLG